MTVADPNGEAGLAGRRFLLPTRLDDTLRRGIEELGGEVDEIDLIRREPLASPELDALFARVRAGEFDWVIVTSPFTPIALEELGFPLSEWDAPGLRFAAVGSGSAAAVESAVGRIDLVPAEGIGGAALAEVFPDGPGRAVIPGAEALSAALPPALSARGWQVEHVGVYRTTAVDEVPQELRARWRAGHYDALVATAATVARAAAALLGTTGLGATGLGGAGRVVALGAASAEAARESGFTDVVIARDATAEALLEAVFEAVFEAGFEAGFEAVGRWG
jgi:uroporphyrinogen-III synthase